MVGVDANLIRFQRSGFEFERTIALLKSGRRIVWTDCEVGISIGGARLVAANQALDAAVLPGPNEITIKFFR